MYRSHRIRAGVLSTTLAVVAGLLATSTAAAIPPASLPASGSDILARDSWIVTLADGADARAEAPGLARAAGGRVGQVYTFALDGFQLIGTAAAAAALESSPRVQSVQPDRAVYLTETLPWGVKRIDAFVPGGDGAYQAGYRGAGARIAVLDTGIDLDHPDLGASIDHASGRNCLDPSAQPNDGYGHGSHVAGTAAAPLNGSGVVGVAPEAELVAVKVFDDGGNSAESLVLCGLDHIVALNSDGDPANDIDVANMSWGEQRSWGDCSSDPLHGAICRAAGVNIKLIAGAGNSASNGNFFVPAAYSEVLSISASADFDGEPGGLAGCGLVLELLAYVCDDTVPFFSNYNGEYIAPGVQVYSTWANGTYQTSSGTSMSTPHVTGVVALMTAENHALTADEIRAVLQATGECPNGEIADADGSPGCAGQGSWSGDQDGNPDVMPNALRAAAAAGSGEPPPPPPPPPDPTEPGAPVLNSASGGADSVTLSWTAPADDGGSPITGYEIWRGTTSGAETLLASIGVASTYVDVSVAGGVTYWYQVAAVNAIGSGPRSNELSASTISTPSAPTLLGAPADGAAVLSWTVPDDDGGSPISGYNLYRSASGGPEGLLASTGAGETTYIDGGLSNGTEYTYRVAASNTAGEGTPSNAVTVIPTSDATTPGAPQALTATKTPGSFAVTLQWAPPATDGGSPIATYFVYRQAAGETSFTFIGSTPDGATTSYLDAAVQRRTSYTYYVEAWNGYGPGPPSNQASIRSK